VNKAYKFAIAWLINQFSGETETCYHFILPSKAINIVKKVKLDLIETLKTLHPIIMPVIKYFEPNLPRKYLTVMLTGSWKQIVTAKDTILSEIKKLFVHEDIDQFFPSVYAQIYRHILKNTAKFVHTFEKWFASYFNQREQRKNYILKFWDVYSAEILCVNKADDNLNEFRVKVINYLRKDTDTLLNLIRLCESESQMEYIIQSQFKLSVKEAFRNCCSFYEIFFREFEGKNKSEYLDFYLQGITSQLIENVNETHFIQENNSKMLEKITEDVRQVNTNKKFTVFPMSFGTDIEMSTWNPSPDSKISSYLHNLELRKFILGSENHVSQVVDPVKASDEVKENAHIMIGCEKSPNNFLYVLFPDKSEVTPRFI
jgi:hypothetical protein